MCVRIHFLGAVRTVTGSMFIVEANGRRVLIDCGLFQGRRQEAWERNRSLPFDPRSVDAMILTHAHIDHSGNIPTLVKSGFEGNIFCTAATRDLCSVMLRDSAHVQQKDAEFVNKKHARKGLPPVEPLYNSEDAVRSLKHFIAVAYEREFLVANGITARLRDAGHILGSASLEIEVHRTGSPIRIGFTGDLGRKNAPILRDPSPLTNVDVLISESTYGGRVHEPYDRAAEMLADVVNRTVARGGKIIVPAFSVGRTQELVYYLHILIEAGRIPEIPIFVDSPLSVNVTEVFRMHPECYDEETLKFLDRHEDPFGFRRLRYITHVEESKELNRREGPFMIISASGMCEAGRILHHLANNIEDERNTILIVGYMAEHTLGKKLVDKWEEVRIFGEPYRRKAEVVVLNAFSAHADRDEITAYLSALEPRPSPIFLVHGEETQTLSLLQHLQGNGFKSVYAPQPGDTVEI
ncbi:MAG: MBL fold metallo-hydrolase [candidate division KSB1 bacterium]|nr:MBL fold metallo-hydrolase [candidate division KSB1 bacterium]